MHEATEQLTYSLGAGLTLPEFTALLDNIWSELGDERVVALLNERGLALGDLRGKERAAAIQVIPAGRGLDPISVAVIVKFVIPVAAKVTLDVWTNFILPEIKRRKGAAAIQAVDPKA